MRLCMCVLLRLCKQSSISVAVCGRMAQEAQTSIAMQSIGKVQVMLRKCCPKIVM